MVGGTFTTDRLNVDGVGAIAQYFDGEPYTAAGALAVAIDGTPAYDDQGLWYDTNGRVCVASVAAITHYANGLPFTATGLLAVAAGGTVTAHASGLSFDTNNRLVTT
jgi:hypothetical protein